MVGNTAALANARAGLLVALVLLISAACSPASPQAPLATPLIIATLLPEHTSVPPRVTSQPAATIPPAPAVEITATSELGFNELESGDLPDYYGGLVITLDYVGQTILMKPGQGFLFSLGNSFDWEIKVDPPEVLTINQQYVSLAGEQGVYIAREKGKATVKAIGSPRCLQNDPPCARPNVLFTMYVKVE